VALEFPPNFPASKIKDENELKAKTTTETHHERRRRRETITPWGKFKSAKVEK
jgi:hypothetical protein